MKRIQRSQALLAGIFAAALGGGALTAHGAVTPGESRKTGSSPTSPAVEAEITSIPGNGVFTARAHIWVSQYVDAVVCTREIKPSCTEKADILPGETAGTGKIVHLTNIATLAFNPDRTTRLPEPAHLRPRQDRLAGPVEADVTRAGDGDTVEVAAKVWPRQTVVTDIRIGGIDTPEKKGRAQCAEEAALAEKASAETTKLLLNKRVLLTDLQFEKYGGRMLGTITTMDGIDAGKNLISKGLARAYDGKKKSNWCPASRKTGKTIR